MFLRNGKTISLDRDLVIGEDDDAITIPAASLQNDATRAEYGITWEADPARADDRYYWNGDLNTPKELPLLRDAAINEIKRIRQLSLDTFPKSSGISAIYAENIAAAQAVKSGAGDSTLVRTGSTAQQYIDSMAAGMGVPPEQFIAYVLAENEASAKLVAEIEREYVRLAYAYVPACSFDQVKAVVQEYQAFCQERVQ